MEGLGKKFEKFIRCVTLEAEQYPQGHQCDAFHGSRDTIRNDFTTK